MATPPQGAGNSDDLRTPVNATQGAQDALVSDTYQFDFDDFLGPRSPDLMHRDAAQHGSSKNPTSAAPRSTLPDSPHFQFSGSTPVNRRPRHRPAHHRTRSRLRRQFQIVPRHVRGL
ncbi:hypothetical protein E4U58_006587 [Claviceps cyperi]|nr:hypothetical protein E4U58_006587 [Claviceps cyperi]